MIHLIESDRRLVMSLFTLRFCTISNERNYWLFDLVSLSFRLWPFFLLFFSVAIVSMLMIFLPDFRCEEMNVRMWAISDHAHTSSDTHWITHLFYPSTMDHRKIASKLKKKLNERLVDFRFNTWCPKWESYVLKWIIEVNTKCLNLKRKWAR